MRTEPIASSSSMKTIAGAFFRASWKSDRIRAAPSPANISTKDDALAEKKFAPDSVAIAFASSVFPVPGGPCSSTPFGTRAPSRSKRLRSVRKSTTSRSSSFASSSPAMSSQEIDSEVALSIGAGLTRGMYWVVFQRRKAMTPKRTIGSQVRMKSAISPVLCGIGVMATLFARVRLVSTPPDGDKGTPLWCNPQVDRVELGMLQPPVAPRVGQGRVEPEVVQHDRRTRRQQAENGIRVVLRVPRVDEQEVERGLAGH